MLNNNHFSEGLLNAYGWEKITSKNNVMVSYVKDKFRLNHYFTTGTVMIQSPSGVPEVHRGIFSDDKLEEIICKIK